MSIYLQPTFWKKTNTLFKKGWLNLESYVKSLIGSFEKTNVPYPFIGMGYQLPDAQLIETGEAYLYSDNNEIKKVKVKGVFVHYGSSAIYYYFGTIKVTPYNKNTTIPFVFPSNLTGMVMASEDANFFDSTYDKIATPLAIGAKFYDIDAMLYNPLDSLQITMYEYGLPDEVTGEINYALVLEATCEVPTTDLQNALVSYEIELLVPKKSEVTLWQD